ncbi:aspartate carbamoyltransferase catalytic subunit [Stomatohabitans albus]|uniref:aspartate carbamoyltransferase catalytic subunit n=1 Tax=Stomatohabitans albus TaxID=3110766 RepID=UPI00300C14BE
MPNLLGLDDCSPELITNLLNRAEELETSPQPLLAGKTVCSLFVEDSTRTRLSFEHAVHKLGGNVMTFSTQGSSMAKGETLYDTVCTIAAMGIDAIVMRHRENGMPFNVAEWVDLPVLNGGDGSRAHPTQGLLDLLTIRQHFGRIHGVTVTIVGDLAHSRVMRSLVAGLPKMGATIRLVAPLSLMPNDVEHMGVEVYTDLDQALIGTDVVYLLRIQHERMVERFEHLSAYVDAYGLNSERLHRLPEHVAIMHPGPINRDVEIESAVVDDPRCLILQQVRNGVAVRMAALDWAINS